jgi:hypothetical protein
MERYKRQKVSNGKQKMMVRRGELPFIARSLFVRSFVRRRNQCTVDGKIKVIKKGRRSKTKELMGK